jgi:hypothetical protein
VTKKEIYELLDENVLTITVVTNDGEIAYEGPVSKLKAAVKSADVSVNQASNYDKYYLVGHRTIVVKGSSIAPLVIMRKKR